MTFQTIATLHQCALFEGEEGERSDPSPGEILPSASLHWEVIQYGIPVVIANSNGVVLCLADIETGDKVCEFLITTASQYVALDGHFHVLAVSCGCFGISFADTAAGEKVLALLKQVVPCVGIAEEDLEPTAKQRKIKGEEEAEGGEEVEEEENKGVDGNVEADGSDEVDFGMFHRHKSKKKRIRPEISDPKDFQHLSHVGVDTAISDLTKSMNWTDTLKRKERIVSQVFASNIPMYSEDDTVSTTSFEVSGPPAPPPGPPPPPAPPPPAVVPPPAKVVLKKKGTATEITGGTDFRSALAEELKKGVVLRPIGSDRSSISSGKSSIASNKSFDSLQDELKEGVVLRSIKTNGVMTLPLPPRRTQSENLLFEIKTFRRKKLRHISTASSNMTDFSDDKSLESVMKRSLATMFKKMNDMEISNVGTVTSSGEDSFDGLLE